MPAVTYLSSLRRAFRFDSPSFPFFPLVRMAESRRPVTDSSPCVFDQGLANRYCRVRFSPQDQPPHALKEQLILGVKGLDSRFETLTRRRTDCTSGPCHPKFNDYETRLKTFADWPRLCPAKPTVLAAASFFYCGFAEGILDCVRCFYCDQGVCFWQYGDDPIYEHTRYNSDCPFIKSIKQF